MDKNKIIPKLRGDIVFRVIENGDKKNILIYDERKIANQPLIFPVEFASLLQFFDGKTTIGQLEKIISQYYQEDTNKFLKNFENLIEDLNILCYLETPYFFQVRDDYIAYQNSPTRPPICIGHSYPSEPNELKKYLKTILNKSKLSTQDPSVNSIIVPHIDFAIGDPAHHVYAEAYNLIKDNQYDVYIIFGTSHYGNSDYFMLTYKDFETPFGVAFTDKEFISHFSKLLSYDLIIDEQAHRFEHSIEFQILLLQYVFKNPNIRVIPILVGPFHEFMYSDSLPTSNGRIQEFFTKFRDAIFEKFKNPLFIASVDFSHFGRKFHDPFDAMEHINTIKAHDYKLIEHIKNCDPDGFFKEISKVKDRFKICGLSPIYSLLSVVKPTKIDFLAYDFWDDAQNKSIVSFASLCFKGYK